MHRVLGSWTSGSVAALVAVASLLVTACGGPSPGGSGTGAGTGKSVYRIGLSSAIKGFDPIDANDVPTAGVLGAIHECLVQYAYLKRPYVIEPALAESWSVSEDGKTWTFKLKKGVRYHDDPVFQGKPRDLVAGDFVYAWKRLADKSLHANGWWIFESWIQGLDEWREAGGDYAKPVPGLETPDPHTLVVKLNRPYPQFLWVLAMVYSAPVPPEAVEKYGKDFLNHAIGTGPYRLRQHVPSSRIDLVRHEHFRPESYPSEGSEWAKQRGLLADAGKKLPFVDEIRYEIILESQPAWLQFMAGKLDRNSIPKDSFEGAMSGKDQLARDMVAKGIELQIWPSQTLWWVGMNVADPVFQGEKGLHLRRAIAYSHDAAKFVKVLYNDRGQVSKAAIPPMLPAYDETRLEWDYDFSLEKARKELELAGYPGGVGAPKLRFDTRSADSLSRQIAEFVVRGLEEIGLKVEIQTNTFQQFLQKARQGQAQIFWGGWVGDYPDEENWLQLLYSKNARGGTNYSQYENPEFDELYLKTREMADSPERRAMIQKALNLVLRDCPQRMSFVATDYILSHRWVKNYMYGDAIYNGQKYVRIDDADRAKGL